MCIRDRSGGSIFLNSSLIEDRPIRGDVVIYEIPLNDLTRQLPDHKGANVVMLGAFIKKSALVSPDTMIRVLRDTFGGKNPEAFKLNKLALMLGYDYLD